MDGGTVTGPNLELPIEPGRTDAAQAIAGLPLPQARMLAVEILLADPGFLGDDVLESCLYVLREKLRAS